jgi:hypothetical protein
MTGSVSFGGPVVTFQRRQHARNYGIVKHVERGVANTVGSSRRGLCIRRRVQPDTSKSDRADRERNQHGDGADRQRAGYQPELAGLRGARLELPHTEQRTRYRV